MNARTFVGHLKAEVDPEVGYDVEELADLIAEHQGAVAGNPSTIEVTFDVEAEDFDAAVLRAQIIALDLITKVGAKVVNVARLEVITAAEQQAGLERPIIPELVGLTEVADILGVSKQRVGQLRERSDFPEPVAVLASGPVWTRPSLNHFIDGWSRKPGRPRIERDDAQLGAIGAAAVGVLGVEDDGTRRFDPISDTAREAIKQRRRTEALVGDDGSTRAERAARRASAKIDAAIEQQAAKG